jgi:hypothetical protein
VKSQRIYKDWRTVDLAGEVEFEFGQCLCRQLPKSGFRVLCAGLVGNDADGDLAAVASCHHDELATCSLDVGWCGR